MMLSSKKILSTSFLYSFALTPLLSLFWDKSIGSLKINWIIYPILVSLVIVVIASRRAVGKQLAFGIILSFLFLVLIILKQGEWQDILRLFISLLPFFYIDTIIVNQNDQLVKRVLRILILCTMIPIIISLLQMSGHFPFYEFDTTGGVVVGRLSGGYSKPNNFVAVLFPIFLFGFWLLYQKKRKILATLTFLFIIFIIYETGLRIAVLAYSAILLLLLFFPRILIALVANYYRYFINLFIGLISFFALFIFHEKIGLVDGIRGRLPMWEAHATEYFESSPTELLLGKSIVLLEGNWNKYLVKYSAEVHNNSFRILIVFGVIGFLVYSLFMRTLALKVLRFSENKMKKLLVAACFLFYIIYSITNEPIFYPAISWSIFFWMFLKLNDDVDKNLNILHPISPIH